MTKLYLVRHGQSLANLGKAFAGHYNVDLTDTGKAQALRVAQYFTSRGIVPDAIYSSDLIRAHETARPLSEATGIPIRDREDLREIYAGAWEGMPFVEIYEKYREEFEVWLTTMGDARCTDGESVFELADRVLPAIGAIAREWEGKTVVIATHATPIRAIVSTLQVGDLSVMKDLTWVANASITTLTYENEKLLLGEVGTTEHLAGLVTTLPSTK